MPTNTEAQQLKECECPARKAQILGSAREAAALVEKWMPENVSMCKSLVLRILGDIQVEAAAPCPCEELPEIPCCPPHEQMMRSGVTKPLDNCFVCIRNQRDELVAENAQLRKDYEQAKALADEAYLANNLCLSLVNRGDERHSSELVQDVLRRLIARRNEFDAAFAERDSLRADLSKAKAYAEFEESQVVALCEVIGAEDTELAADKVQRLRSDLEAALGALKLLEGAAGTVAASHKQFCECPVCLLAMGKSLGAAGQADSQHAENQRLRAEVDNVKTERNGYLKFLQQCASALGVNGGSWEGRDEWMCAVEDALAASQERERLLREALGGIAQNAEASYWELRHWLDTHPKLDWIRGDDGPCYPFMQLMKRAEAALVTPEGTVRP